MKAKFSVWLWLAVLLVWGCGEVEITEKTNFGVDSLPVLVETPPAPCDSQVLGPELDPTLLFMVPPFDGFDYPVGKPDAVGYYKFRGYLGMEHLGEDWNGTGGGNTDFFDRLYAAGNGVVWYSGDLGGGWGEVIRILHNIGTAECPVYVETIYAHLRSRIVRAGTILGRGDVIGGIGDANGKYVAHLHFEIRTGPAVGKSIRAGYDGDTIGFRSPTPFIEAYRPQK